MGEVLRRHILSLNKALCSDPPIRHSSAILRARSTTFPVVSLISPLLTPQILDICHSSFVIRHSSFVIRHSSFVIRHSSFVIAPVARSVPPSPHFVMQNGERAGERCFHFILCLATQPAVIQSIIKIITHYLSVSI